MKREYVEKLERLRRSKLEQTADKLEWEGYLDEDDYGRIVPTFEWAIIPNSPDGNFYGASGWAENFYDLMEKHDVYDDENDAFSGRWMYFMSKMRPSNFDDTLIPTELKRRIEFYGLDAGIGLDAHFCPDYRIGLSLGWKGLLDKLEQYEKQNARTEEDHVFYDSHRKVIKGVQLWISHHIDYLEKKYRETGEKVYLDKLCVNRRIINDPPETLREALQWIIWFHLASRTFNRDGAGGQLDSLLLPYYEKDREKGILDRDDAIYYLACFLINDPVYWQIGGPDKDGCDQSSELSYMILEAAEYVNTSLNITLRVHDGMDAKLFDKAVRLLVRHKRAWPRFSGDNALVSGFMKLGYSLQEARERIAVGCNWMSLPGREYTLNDLYKVNLARIFEIAWNDMMRASGYPGLAGDIRTYHPVVKGKTRLVRETPSIELLYSCFQKRLAEAVEAIIAAMEFHLEHQKDNEVELLLNLLSHGPIEKGRDVSSGGAEYYNLALDASGIATVSDSFSALEQRIVEEGRISWKELNSYLRTNWTGDRGERTRLMMKDSDRYGSSRRGQRWAERISRDFSDLVVSYCTRDRKFIPGLFSWAKPHLFGKAVGATPDGRRYGDPINHGANPSSDVYVDASVLAYSNAIAAIQPGYGNTAPYQMEFDPFFSGGDPVEIVKAVILAHFKKGGTLINVNIVDKEKILEADRNPEAFPDLVVRVTGFTAYFCMLTPEFRRLVVERVMNRA